MEYNADELRDRFLEEFARIKSNNPKLSNTKFSLSIGRSKNFISQLTNPKGTQYYIVLKDVYYAVRDYGFDLNFVLFGVRVIPVGDIPALEDLNRNGHWKKK